MIYLTGSLKKFAKQVAKELDNCGQLIAQLIINFGISSDPGKFLKLHRSNVEKFERYVSMCLFAIQVSIICRCI